MPTFCSNAWSCRILVNISNYCLWRLPCGTFCFSISRRWLGIRFWWTHDLPFYILCWYHVDCGHLFYFYFKKGWEGAEKLLSHDTEVFVRDIDQIKIVIFHVWDIIAAWEKLFQKSIDLVEELDSEWSISVKVCDECCFVHLYFVYEDGDLVNH